MFSTDACIVLMIPFVGTSLGAACVFFLKEVNPNLQRTFLGFAAGVMVAASVWSLIIPALEMCESMGDMQVVPTVVGFFLGIALLLLLDTVVPHLHIGVDLPEGKPSHLKQTTMLVLAVTIHNIPEGAACGAIVAAALAGGQSVTMTAAFTLSVGIALQNFPEGAIISLPLMGEGSDKMRSFVMGVLSGIVEPIAGTLTIIFAYLVTPALPYLMALAAGAMIYVVVEELVPEASQGKHSNLGTLSFSVGFIVMMVLDVLLG